MNINKYPLITLFMIMSVTLALAQSGTEYPLFIEMQEEVSRDNSPQLLAEMFSLQANDELRLRSQKMDPLGFRHDTYQQFYKGVKVENGTYKVHSKNGMIKTMSGNYRHIFVDININPSLSESAALQFAINAIGAQKYVWDTDGGSAPYSELVIHADHKGYFQPSLTYKFEITAVEPFSHNAVFVNAHTGQVVEIIDLVCTIDSPATGNSLYEGPVDFTADFTGSFYRLRQTTDGDGINTRDLNNGTSPSQATDFTNPTSDFGSSDETAVQLHYAAEQSHRYFVEEHGRNSYDGLGSVLNGYAHYGNNVANAFWSHSFSTNTGYMSFGDGNGSTILPLVTSDIVGHELMHGVEQTAYGIGSSNESRALAESFSDIFGENIERYIKGSNNWIMGDESFVAANGIRNMMDPKSKNHPDTYEGEFWAQSGFHNRGEVQNKWYYILSQGEAGVNDNGDSYDVTGIGMDKAVDIAYRNVNVYMTPASQFADARTGAIQAAIDLFGAGSPEVIATTNAWYAVGVGDPFPTGDNEPPSVPGNLTASNITQTSADLSWTASTDNTGVTGYNVYIDDVLNGNTTNLNYPLTGLAPNTTYNIKVTSLDAAANESDPATTSVTTLPLDTQPPSVPTNLTASNITQNSADLTWNASSDNVGVTAYNIYVNGSLDGTSTNASYSLSGLSPNTTYSVGVSALDAAGNESGQATTSVTTLPSDTQAPSVPTNLTASSITQNSADLSWNASSDNVGVTAYNIYVNGSLDGTSTNTSYSLSGLSPSTTYSIGVSALDAAGNESGQATGSFTTLSPTYCNANGNDSNGEWIQSISVGAFSNNSGNNGGYGNFTNQTINVDPGQSYNITLTPGFAGGAFNEYWIVWIDYNQDGDFTDVGETVFNPGSSTSVINGTINISASASGSTRMRIAMQWNGIPSSCGTFQYGEVEDYTVSFDGSSGGDTQAPSTPTNLTASNTTQTSTNLSWNASSDNVGVTGYRVYIDGNLDGTTASTSYAVSGLSAGTTYLMEVSAIDAAGNESGRAATNVTTQSSSDTEAPSTPTNLTASGTTQTSTNLSWNASSDNVGVAGYRVYVNGSLNGTTAGTTYAVTGLTAATTYLMEVSAFDAAGNESGRAATNVTTEDDGGTPTYCNSQSSNSNFEWIQSVAIGNFNNNSGNDGGYGDYTGQTVNATAGNSYNITLTPGFAGTAYAEQWRIWIDFNRDGDFTDAGELAFDSNFPQTNAVSGSINIPASASGTTRMRISMKWNGPATSCESYQYGEVEDYSISFSGGGGGGDTEAPSTPTNLTASNTTQISTELSWNASTDNVGVTGYRVYVDGSLDGTTASTTYSVTGLTASTTYLMEVSAVDAAGNESGRAATNVTTEDDGGNEPTYCDAQGQNSNFEWIQSVAIGGFSNNSGNNGGYGDYTGQTVNVSAGNAYNITLTPGFAGTAYAEQWRIWIDFNRDGDFTDAGEQVFDSNFPQVNPVNGSINIPGSASGTTRMRIAMKWNAAPTSCESFQYGEVEDYTIAIGSSAQLSAISGQAEDVKRPGLSNLERPNAINNHSDRMLEGVVLYPNPVVNQLRVMLPQGVEAMRIVALNGAVVKEFTVFEKSNFIDVTDLNNGVYFLQVQTADQVFTKRFVKQQ
jgi:bacillolysin